MYCDNQSHNCDNCDNCDNPENSAKFIERRRDEASRITAPLETAEIGVPPESAQAFGIIGNFDSSQRTEGNAA